MNATAKALGGKPVLDYARAIPRVDWYNAVDSLLVSHIWFGNWSFLGLRAWIYKLFMALYLLAAAGLADLLDHTELDVVIDLDHRLDDLEWAPGLAGDVAYVAFVQVAQWEQRFG